MDFVIMKTYWPLMSPIIGNVTLPTPILIWIRYLPYYSRNWEVESLKTIIESWKCIKKSEFWHKEGIKSPYGSHTMECEDTLTHSGLG